MLDASETVVGVTCWASITVDSSAITHKIFNALISLSFSILISTLLCSLEAIGCRTDKQLSPRSFSRLLTRDTRAENSLLFPATETQQHKAPIVQECTWHPTKEGPAQR